MIDAVAIIPARGGSKRIPRKNLKSFFSKPVIAWSIESAIKSELFSEIIVSTDDQEIKDISEKYGARVPFLRSEELSNDHTPLAPVVKDVLDWLDNNEAKKFEYACCILATAPLISIDDLKQSFRLMRSNSNLSYCVSVASFPYPIQRSLMITDDGHVNMMNRDNYSKRSQDFIEAFHDAGQFYWGRSSCWRKGEQLFDGSTGHVLVPRSRVQDIDSIEDWTHAERLFSLLQS